MIHYTDSVHGITTKMLQGFFMGWKKRLSPETHLAILKNSDHALLAIDPEAGTVVGFVTAISDGIQAAFTLYLRSYQPIGEKGSELRSCPGC